MNHHTSRLPSPALVIAVCALLVALGGTGYAVSAGSALPKHSVGAAQLKKNAVRSRAVHNGSLKAKDLASGVLPRVFVKNVGGASSVDVTALVGEPGTVVSSMSLPAGTYYVRANGYAINPHAALVGELRCSLGTSGDILVTGTGGLFVPIEPHAGTNANRGFFALDVALTLSAPGTVEVACTKGAAAQSILAGASMSAVTTTSVTAVP